MMVDAAWLLLYVVESPSKIPTLLGVVAASRFNAANRTLPVSSVRCPLFSSLGMM